MPALKGDETDNKPPIQWSWLQYRLKFHMSAKEFKEQNYNDVMADMEMLSIEADIERQVNPKKNGSNKQQANSRNRHQRQPQRT